MATIFIEHPDITWGVEPGRTLTTIPDGATIIPARESTIRIKMPKETHELVYVRESEGEVEIEFRAKVVVSQQ